MYISVHMCMYICIYIYIYICVWVCHETDHFYTVADYAYRNRWLTSTLSRVLCG